MPGLRSIYKGKDTSPKKSVTYFLPLQSKRWLTAEIHYRNKVLLQSRARQLHKSRS